MRIDAASKAYESICMRYWTFTILFVLTQELFYSQVEIIRIAVYKTRSNQSPERPICIESDTYESDNVFSLVIVDKKDKL